jgi:hypothetical protein
MGQPRRATDGTSRTCSPRPAHRSDPQRPTPRASHSDRHLPPSGSPDESSFPPIAREEQEVSAPHVSTFHQWIGSGPAHGIAAGRRAGRRARTRQFNTLAQTASPSRSGRLASDARIRAHLDDVKRGREHVLPLRGAYPRGRSFARSRCSACRRILLARGCDSPRAIGRLADRAGPQSVPMQVGLHFDASAALSRWREGPKAVGGAHASSPTDKDFEIVTTS